MTLANLPKTVAAAVTGCLLLVSFAVAEPLTVTPKLKAGESFNLLVTKSKERRAGNNPGQRNKVETSIAVKILEASDSRVVLAWTFGETRLLEPKAEPDPRSKALMDLTKGIRLEVQVEAPNWSPRLVNYDEVKVRFDRVIEEILKVAKDDQERSQLRQVLGNMFASREAIESSVLREASVYLFPLGKTVETGKPLTYETRIATPLSEKPIPARGTVTLAAWDRKAGKATIHWDQALDRQAASEVVREWLERVTKQAGKPMPPDEKLPELDIADKAEFTVLTRTGMCQSARHARKVVAPGAAEIQTVEFVRK